MEYKTTINISELIKHNEVMKIHNLGPNGALIYCMEFLEANVDWLLQKILNLKDHYLIFDCPGQVNTFIIIIDIIDLIMVLFCVFIFFSHQVELYTHHKSISAITEKLGLNLIRLCSVHLVDSHQCSDPGKYEKQCPFIYLIYGFFQL